MGTRILSTGLAILYSLAAFTGCSSRSRDDSSGYRPLTAADSAAARDVVLRFGERLQRVSLLAPDSLARASIRSEYGGFVSPALLETWLEHPSGAPGRVTSSPWPDRIEIVEARATPNGAPHIAYVGSIVERASDTPPGEAVRRIPVRITLVRGPEGWRIVQFAQVERGKMPAEPDTAFGADEASVEQAPERAADVIREYYRAIAERRYRDAYSMWGSKGQASRKTFDQFRRGFEGTASVEVDVAPPGPVGAAAGSRYVDVPVLVNARRDDGTRETFSGTYTLRRSVVDGATPEQRAWHIASADIRRMPMP